jgi:hypothetical protein
MGQFFIINLEKTQSINWTKSVVFATMMKDLTLFPEFKDGSTLEESLGIIYQ